jgi:hypothetical protein
MNESTPPDGELANHSCVVLCNLPTAPTTTIRPHNIQTCANLRRQTNISRRRRPGLCSARIKPHRLGFTTQHTAPIVDLILSHHLVVFQENLPCLCAGHEPLSHTRQTCRVSMCKRHASKVCRQLCAGEEVTEGQVIPQNLCNAVKKHHAQPGEQQQQAPHEGQEAKEQQRD